MKKLLFALLTLVTGISSFKSLQKQTDFDLAVSGASGESARVAIDWYNLQLRLILHSDLATAPLVTAQNFGYIGIGLYEAVRHGTTGSVSLSSLLYQMPEMPAIENNNNLPWSIAANAALAGMVRSFYPDLSPQDAASIDSLENACNSQLRPLVQPAVFQRLQNYGRSVAQTIFQWSTSDNYNLSGDGYMPAAAKGSWVSTPPRYAPAAAPLLGKTARPFLEAHVHDKAPDSLLPYSEAPASEFYKMAKEVYDVSRNLTGEQRTIALYWDDIGVGKGFTPPGHCISLLNQALLQRQADLALAAEAYARIGIAIRDALISCFRLKYTYNMVRPVTYIQSYIDSRWLPLIGTPNHPECPAAHAFVTGAAMQAITGLFGNAYAVTDHTYDFLGFAPRTYTSFFAVAEESGISRLYGGIHYRPSIELGLKLGKELGSRVGSLQLIKH